MKKLIMFAILLNSLTALTTAVSAQSQSEPERWAVPKSCHVTQPNGRTLPWQTFEPPGQRTARADTEFWKYNEWHGNKSAGDEELKIVLWIVFETPARTYASSALNGLR